MFLRQTLSKCKYKSGHCRKTIIPLHHVILSGRSICCETEHSEVRLLFDRQVSQEIIRLSILTAYRLCMCNLLCVRFPARVGLRMIITPPHNCSYKATPTNFVVLLFFHRLNRFILAMAAMLPAQFAIMWNDPCDSKS